MDWRDLDEILARTLDDGRLSRGERKALGAVLEGMDPDRDRRGVLRSRVFDRAETGVSQRRHPVHLHTRGDLGEPIVQLPAQVR